MPPYSGLEPTCPKCGWIGASLQYREARGPIALPWNTAYVVDVARPERLARHCQSCGFHWDEAPLDAPSVLEAALPAEGGQAR
ncbi:ribosomal protein S27AE [Streptosporangium album]|uniref:Ribosomal protein S27AE n=1 Tax=Streptosporangium album TaxID=47479 RepID=A0A7W7W7Z8_9ACTN|nr:hypothetical protein [Streptosporangium album]MBB4937812.1 ribosomal protein S27AE [Streptosporangium album]